MSRQDETPEPRRSARPSRPPPMPSSGLGDFARSLGMTLGVVRRLLPIPEDPFRGASLPRVALPRPRQKKGPGRKELLRAQAQAQAEVARLAAELEVLHEKLAGGHGDQVLGRSELAGGVERARRLRKRLQDKRDELVRVERHLAREQRLGRPGDEAPRLESSEPAPRSRRQKLLARERARQERKEAERHERARRIAQRAPFEDRYARRNFARLAEALFDPDVGVRRDAAARLGDYASPAAYQLLVIALDDPQERVRASALSTLSLVDGKGREEIFRRHLQDGSAVIRLSALRGLGTLPKGPGRAALLRALEDRDARVRATAAAMIGTRRDRQALRPLCFALSDDEPSVRAAAAQALGNVGDDRAVFSLLGSLLDGDGQVLEAVGWALSTLAGVALEELAPELSGEERVQALRAWWGTARLERAIEVAGGPPVPPQAFHATVMPTPAQRALAEPAPRPPAAPAPAPPPARQPPAPAPEPAEETAAGLDAAPDLGALSPDLGTDLGIDSEAETALGLDAPEAADGGLAAAGAEGEAAEAAQEEGGEGFEDMFAVGEEAGEEAGGATEAGEDEGGDDFALPIAEDEDGEAEDDEEYESLL
ncbi:MAG: HEAT repeat domain-containing protein [Myxococcales bacterium]|nr:HEAT repeat domain-containing protein [Myxococcales bacterium]